MSQKPYSHASISISDCQKLFDLNLYSPEQIVSRVFPNNRSHPLSKDQFIQNFQAAFATNPSFTGDNKPFEASCRIYEVCSQGAPEITIDQLGKGIGVFTSRRENMGVLRDLFFYLDRENRGVVQEAQIQSFLKDASQKGVNISFSKELADFSSKIAQEKGKFEVSYWTLHAYRNHPGVIGLIGAFKEFQARRTGSASQSPVGKTQNKDGFVERTTDFAMRTNEIGLEKSSQEQEKTAGAKSYLGEAENRAPEPQPIMFGGEGGILSRETRRITCFEEFLELGSKMGFNQISAKDFLRHKKDFFHQHKKDFGDIMLHEFIRMSIDLFKKEEDDYYQFVDAVIQLFQFMDINDNGILEINEALQGIVHLFGGTEEDKIIAAFMLFDTDDSGFIEFNEVYGFIYATIKLKEYKGQCYTQDDIQAMKKIAFATATDVFKAMDLDSNGKVTVEEFVAWYKSTKGQIQPVEIEAARSIKEYKLKKYAKKVLNLKLAQKKFQLGAVLKQDFLKNEIVDCKADVFIIEEIRKKIPFEKIHIQLAVESLKTEFPSRVVNYTQFQEFIIFLIKQYSLTGYEHVHEVSHKLFNALDSNKNGLLEISEIGTGLGLLCGGNQIEKMKAGFDLFDENDDKVLSFGETIHFMDSFFKVIQTDSPDLEVFNKDSYHYAYALAFSIFQDNGLPLEGFLEFYQLKKWVQSLQQ